MKIVGGALGFDIRREKQYYNPEDLQALAERKHGVGGVARKKADALAFLASPSKGKRMRSEVGVDAGDGGSHVAKTQRTPVRKSPRLVKQSQC